MLTFCVSFVCLCMWIGMLSESRSGVGSPEVRVTRACESPDVVGGSWAPVLLKCSKCSYPLGHHLSGPPRIHFPTSMDHTDSVLVWSPQKQSWRQGGKRISQSGEGWSQTKPLNQEKTLEDSNHKSHRVLWMVRPQDAVTRRPKSSHVSKLRAASHCLEVLTSGQTLGHGSFSDKHGAHTVPIWC